MCQGRHTRFGRPGATVTSPITMVSSELQRPSCSVSFCLIEENYCNICRGALHGICQCHNQWVLSSCSGGTCLKLDTHALQLRIGTDTQAQMERHLCSKNRSCYFYPAFFLHTCRGRYFYCHGIVKGCRALHLFWHWQVP